MKQGDLVNTVSSLLEVEAGELRDSLTGRVIAASGDVLRKIHSVKDAEVGRNALAKVMHQLALIVESNKV